MRYEEFTIEGRNAVREAFRSGKVIDKLYVQDGCQDGPVVAITPHTTPLSSKTTKTQKIMIPSFGM